MVKTPGSTTTISRNARPLALERAARTTRLWLALIAVLATSLSAQDTGRVLCDDSDPAAGCPGDNCVCTDHWLAIRFENGSSVFGYDTFAPGLEVRSQVYIEVTDDLVRAYSFGVRHDPSALALLPGPEGLDVEGTISEAFFQGGFVALRALEGGYVLTTIFADAPLVVVPSGPLVNANYTLLRDVGVEGVATLEFADDLGDPPISVVVTVAQQAFPEMVDKDERNCIDGTDNDADGLVDRDDPDCVVATWVSRQPRTVTDGLIRRSAPASAFRRGDCNGDGAVGRDLSDVVFLIDYAFRAAPEPPCLAACDANGDGRLAGGVSDAVYLIDFTLRGGPPPPVPFPDCGESDGGLSCAAPTERCSG